MAWNGSFKWRIGDRELEDKVYEEEDKWNNYRQDFYVKDDYLEDYSDDWTISDYILEGHSIKLAMDYYQWQKDERLLDYNEELRSDLDYNEELRSNLANVIDYDLEMQKIIEVVRYYIGETVKFIGRKYINDDDEKLCDLLAGLHQYTQVLSEDNRVADTDIKELLTDEKRKYENTPMGEVLNDISGWLELIEQDNNISEHKIYTYKKDLKVLVKKIPRTYSEESKTKYNLLKKLSNCSSGEWRDQLKILQMSISHSLFDDELDGLFENIAHVIEEIINHPIVFKEIENRSFIEKADLIEGFLKRGKNIFSGKKVKRILDKYIDGNGCLGIMKTPKKEFFALSGIIDYAGGVFGDILQSNKEIENVAVALNDYVFEGHGTWARLSDDTCRYTEIVKDKTDVVVLNNKSVYLREDHDDIRDMRVLGFTYGCCERKMQASNGNEFASDKIFFARWKPCPKCIPALANEKGEIRIFAIADNYDEWEEKRYEPFELHEYKIASALTRIK